MHIDLEVDGMSCGHCVTSLKEIIEEMSGILKTEVKLPSSASIDFEAATISKEEIVTHINDSGMYKVK